MLTANTEAPSTRASLLLSIRDVNDQDAWSLFVETYTPLLLRYCRRWGLQEADARDVTQTVFGIIAHSIVGFEYDRSRGRFRNWLGTITRREMRRYLNRSARSGRAAGGESWPLNLQTSAMDPDWMDEFNARIYECAIERVRPLFEEETWTAFELTWVSDRKPAEAGAAMGKPAAWVSRAKYRVLRRLKEEIEFLAADLGVLAGGRQRCLHE